jgi:hypothetical protein
MTDFHKISSYLGKIHTLDKLNKYYDKILSEGVFYTLEDIYKIDRLFYMNYEHHSVRYDPVKANYSNFFLIPK